MRVTSNECRQHDKKLVCNESDRQCRDFIVWRWSLLNNDRVSALWWESWICECSTLEIVSEKIFRKNIIYFWRHDCFKIVMRSENEKDATEEWQWSAWIRAWYKTFDKWRSCYEIITEMLNDRNVMTEWQWCVCCKML